MSFLELRALEHTYPDGTRAVKGVDLSIERGEFVVLLGPSGCGKTTTLRMLAGLELPTGGSIALDGRDVTRLSPSERDVGFVFQFYALYPHLTVAENIGFPLACAGVGRAERARRVADMAERLGLTPLLGIKPRRLSGGDQQRVALARSLVRRPALHLMDEPLGTLDADLRLSLSELIRAEQQELGVTTVYVTHDQEEALRLADRVVVMHGGRILQAAAPSEVYDSPSDLTVADFVGSPGMNRIPGAVVAGGHAFRPDGLDAALPLGRAFPEGRAVLGIRPEFLRPDPESPLRGRVVVDEYLGADRCLHLSGPAGRLVVRVPPDGPRALGAEVGVRLDPARVRLYAPDTGLRMG